MNKEVLNPKEVFETYVANSVSKLDYSRKKVFFLGIMAGAFIALGAQASSVASHGIIDVGLARLISGMVFPVGLMMIVLLGGELFTGDCLLFMGVLAHKVRFSKMLSLLAYIFIANFVGASLVSGLVSFSGQWNYSGGALGAYTLKIAVSKCQISFVGAIASGILCNIIVCVAVLMSTSALTVVGKIFAIFFSILAFVTSGFEHCVANMYYLTAGLFASFNPSYIAKANELYGEIGQLSTQGILWNLTLVTIGNIIGGIMIGVMINIVRQK